MTGDDIILLPVSAECRGFLYSLALGAALCLVFSLLCVLRRVFRQSALQVALSDIAYFILAAGVSFLLAMEYSYGKLRWYMLTGELLGWLLFWFVISPALIRALSLLLTFFIRALKAVISFILFPFKVIMGFVASKTVLIVKKIHKTAKKACKYCGFVLKKYGKSLYNFHVPCIRRGKNAGKEVDGMAKRKKRRSSLLVKLATLCFIVCAAVSFIRTQSDMVAKKRELAALEESIRLQQIANDEAERVLEGGDDLAYIERIAREKLGYAYPDEKIYIDRSGG